MPVGPAPFFAARQLSASYPAGRQVTRSMRDREFLNRAYVDYIKVEADRPMSWGPIVALGVAAWWFFFRRRR